MDHSQKFLNLPHIYYFFKLHIKNKLHGEEFLTPKKADDKFKVNVLELS